MVVGNDISVFADNEARAERRLIVALLIKKAVDGRIGTGKGVFARFGVFVRLMQRRNVDDRRRQLFGQVGK